MLCLWVDMCGCGQTCRIGEIEGNVNEFITCLLQLGTKGLWLTVTQRQWPDFKFPRRRHTTVRLPSSGRDKEKQGEAVMRSPNGTTVAWKEAFRCAGRKATELNYLFSLVQNKSLKNCGEEMVEEIATRGREVS